MDSTSRRSAAIGGLTAVVVFTLLQIAHAMGQQAFEIPAIAADPAKFYGHEITVSGVARSIYNGSRYVGKEKIPVVKLALYEVVNGKSGRRYVNATIPASQFRYVPNVNDVISVSGVFNPPFNVGSIGE